MSDKGKLNGTCNLSRCKSGEKATWYNHGSLVLRKYMR